MEVDHASARMGHRDGAGEQMQPVLHAAFSTSERLNPAASTATGSRRCSLTRPELTQLGHPQLDDEPASRSEVPGGVAETVDLLGLRQQVGDRVEDEIDERVLPGGPGGGHVADDHRDGSLVHLGRSCSTIAADSSMPVTAAPRCARGTATRPVPMANSSAGPVPASSASRSTVGSSTSAANMPSPGVSYR